MKSNLPELIPVFPLNGVIYFPNTNLPLNIFEQRYMDLVNDCMKKDKLMGMVQTKKEGNEVYDVGCLGKISDFRESKDGRILINLSGLIRFEIKNEINNQKKYREFKVHYDKFSDDLNEKVKPVIDNENYLSSIDKVKNFFEKNGLLLNWIEFEKLEINQQINTLAMIAPISNEEKQKLLESTTLLEKSKSLSNIVEFYLHETINDSKLIQ